MKYKAKVDRKIAGKGLESKTYELKKGESADDLDGATLVHCLNNNLVECCEQEKPKRAPANKSATTKRKATKKAPAKKAAKKKAAKKKS